MEVGKIHFSGFSPEIRLPIVSITKLAIVSGIARSPILSIPISDTASTKFLRPITSPNLPTNPGAYCGVNSRRWSSLKRSPGLGNFFRSIGRINYAEIPSHQMHGKMRENARYNGSIFPAPN